MGRTKCASTGCPIMGKVRSATTFPVERRNSISISSSSRQVPILTCRTSVIAQRGGPAAAGQHLSSPGDVTKSLALVVSFSRSDASLNFVAFPFLHQHVGTR